jgi:hypothetical protein
VRAGLAETKAGCKPALRFFRLPVLRFVNKLFLSRAAQPLR